MNSKVAIIIVSYNACIFLQDTIDSIRNTVSEGYRIFVVDNASTDGVREWLLEQEKKCNDLTVILNDENVGFSKACNQGIKATTLTEWKDADVFLLNNDTRLSRNSLQNMLCALYSDDEIGAVSAVTNYGGNRQQVDISFSLPYKYVEYGNDLGIPANLYIKRIQDINNKYGVRNTLFFDAVYEEKVRLYGFAVLIKRFLWDEIGGMDEDFSPGYFEDDALSMEIAKRGYRQLLCKNSFVYHAGSQSFSKLSGTNELLTDHYKLFIAKYGFPILDYCDVNDKLIMGINRLYDDTFVLLHIGCGLGAELKYVRSYYKNAVVVGVESDSLKNEISGRVDSVYSNLSEVYEELGDDVFDVLIIDSEHMCKLSDFDFNIIDKICKSDCEIISDMEEDSEYSYDSRRVRIEDPIKDIESKDNISENSMSTSDLLVNILGILKQNKKSYKKIDFEDIRSLLNEDMRHRIDIYDEAHILKIIETFNKRINEINEAKKENNESKVISLYKEILDGYKYIPGLEHTIQYINKAAFNQEAFRHYKEKTTIVLGDSHVNFFSGNEKLRFYPIGNDINYCPMVNNFPFTVLHLGPCLAYNSMKEGTTYRFKEKIEYLIEQFIMPKANIILSLGEIDLRSHVFKETEIQKCSFERVVRDIFEKYKELITYLKSQDFNIIVYGPIASQPDVCEVDLRFPRVGTENERNDATRLFNDLVREFCIANDIRFFTMFENMINDEGHTDISYLSSDNCHLGQKHIQKAIDKLMEIGALSKDFIYERHVDKLVEEEKNETEKELYLKDNVSDLVEYDALIMATPNDYKRVEILYNKLLKTMPVRKVCFVGNEDVGGYVETSGFGKKIGFINENSILTFDQVNEVMKDALKDILKGQELPRGITGWYYQQFLKMSYSKMCKDDYYLVWDGDTVPCAEFSMFDKDSSKPYFDLKTEYHEEYFNTINKILPGMSKVIKKSFISEHMLINKQYMLELIETIENNKLIKGNTYYEKIIYAIEPEKLMSNSFSEFETYGTFVALKHTNEYKLRDWYSFRYGGDFFDVNKISESDFEWLSKDFFAISFEKGHVVRDDHKNLFDNKEYQEKLSARKMLEIAQEEFSDDSFKESWD